MNNLIIIDDTTCKEDLDQFVTANSDHIKLLLTEEEYNIDLDTLISRIHDTFDNQKILFIKTNDSIIKVASNDILFIEEINDSINLHLQNGKIYSLPDKLSHYISMLSRFNILQINSNTLINIDLIESFIITECTIFCSNGSKFFVDEQYKDKLINELNNIYK